jgi:dipeptidyl aminopeptidase/acylaminoacyl peptidase
VTPTVNPEVFAGHGTLAFVSEGSLWVLSGATGSLRPVPPVAGLVPQDPSFSSDGQWLAFLETSIDPVDNLSTSSLWLARADGSDPREVTGLSGVQVVGWSPQADLFAVLAGPPSTRVPCGYPTTLDLISPTAGTRQQVTSPGIVGAVWSPDGSQLAVSTAAASPAAASPAWSTTLATYPVAGGPSTTWLAPSPASPLDAGADTVIDPAGWWPGWGIGFWVFSAASAHELDATPLDVIASPATPARPLSQTLSEGTTRAFAADPGGGALAVVEATVGTDAARVDWQGKQVQVCTSPSQACAAIDAAPGTVTLDPAWTPHGSALAFVKAPALAGSTFGQAAVASWYAAHELWRYDPATHTSSQVAGVTGASVPQWAGDGRSLLYVADDGIWLLPAGSADPTTDR